MQNTYLMFAMIRKLFALLALLTGLAALSGPANASVLDNLPCDIGIASDSAQDQGGLPETIRKERAAKVTVRCPSSKTAPMMPVPESLRLPVLMGIERSFE